MLKGTTKSEVARVLEAGRSSVNRWLAWYEMAGVDGLKTKGVGRPVRQPKVFICNVLRLLLEQTPRTLVYQRSRWSTALFALLLNLAGALHSQTGQISYVGRPQKTSSLFIELLNKVKGQHRRVKSVAFIVNNYIIHKSKKAQRWLAENPKFKLLFLPLYSPWHNKIGKLRHASYETITRNHQCKTGDELVGQVDYFMKTAAPFPGGKHGLKTVYHS